MVGCCKVAQSYSILRLGTRGLTSLTAVGVFGCISVSNTGTWCNTALTGIVKSLRTLIILFDMNATCTLLDTSCACYYSLSLDN